MPRTYVEFFRVDNWLIEGKERKRKRKNLFLVEHLYSQSILLIVSLLLLTGQGLRIVYTRKWQIPTLRSCKRKRIIIAVKVRSDHIGFPIISPFKVYRSYQTCQPVQSPFFSLRKIKITAIRTTIHRPNLLHKLNITLVFCSFLRILYASEIWSQFLETLRLAFFVTGIQLLSVRRLFATNAKIHSAPFVHHHDPRRCPICVYIETFNKNRSFLWSRKPYSCLVFLFRIAKW